VLPAQIGRLHAGLVLFQDGNDLLFRMLSCASSSGPFF
jgi:hypothetical protein